MPRLRYLTPLAIVVIGVAGCRELAVPLPDDPVSAFSADGVPNFITGELLLRPMNIGDRKYSGRLYATDTRRRPLSAHTAFEDQDGVVMVSHGGQLYYNPVALAQFGVMWANGYRYSVENNEPTETSTEYLRRAVAHAERLWGMRVEEQWLGRDIPYYPYEFGFALHGIGEERVEPTWYSGMAQGYALSLFSWLYELTGEDRYLTWAESTFVTMYRLDQPGNLALGTSTSARTTYIDDDGYLWFDEYPHQMRTKVLNGFIFAIFGLHDYWQITGDQYARALIAGAAATLRRHGDRFIAPSGPSYYCLKHRVQSEVYHAVHIDLWRGLHLITGDWAFEGLARAFEGVHAVSADYGNNGLVAPQFGDFDWEYRYH